MSADVFTGGTTKSRAFSLVCRLRHKDVSRKQAVLRPDEIPDRLLHFCLTVSCCSKRRSHVSGNNPSQHALVENTVLLEHVEGRT